MGVEGFHTYVPMYSDSVLKRTPYRGKVKIDSQRVPSAFYIIVIIIIIRVYNTICYIIFSCGFGKTRNVAIADN